MIRIGTAVLADNRRHQRCALWSAVLSVLLFACPASALEEKRILLHSPHGLKSVSFRVSQKFLPRDFAARESDAFTVGVLVLQVSLDSFELMEPVVDTLRGAFPNDRLVLSVSQFQVPGREIGFDKFTTADGGVPRDLVVEQRGDSYRLNTTRLREIGAITYEPTRRYRAEQPDLREIWLHDISKAGLPIRRAILFCSSGSASCEIAAVSIRGYFVTITLPKPNEGALPAILAGTVALLTKLETP